MPGLSQPKEADLSGDAKPKGRETRLGTAMLEAKRQQENTSRRTGRMVIISDFASNNGPDPLEVARQMKGQGVPDHHRGLGDRKRRGGAPRRRDSRHRQQPDRLCEEPARGAGDAGRLTVTPTRSSTSSSTSKARTSRSPRPWSRSPTGPTRFRSPA